VRPDHGRLERAGDASACFVSAEGPRPPAPSRCMGRRAVARRCPASLRRAACAALVSRRERVPL